MMIVKMVSLHLSLFILGRTMNRTLYVSPDRVIDVEHIVIFNVEQGLAKKLHIVVFLTAISFLFHFIILFLRRRVYGLVVPLTLQFIVQFLHCEVVAINASQNKHL